jgi:hypothetical protein
MSHFTNPGNISFTGLLEASLSISIFSRVLKRDAFKSIKLVFKNLSNLVLTSKGKSIVLYKKKIRNERPL